MNRTRRVAIAVATLSFWCGAIFGAAGFANAQDWPSRPVKFIVPLGPGSGTDIGARLMAEQLTRLWGQSVVVENRIGGDGVVGINAFIAAHAELGYPGMDIALWYGVAAPGGTPAPVVRRLNAELVKILDMPDIRTSLIDQGADVQGGTAEDFDAFMRRESARWSAVVKQAGIKPE